MGGSVIRLDIPRDAVLVACHIKSTRGHTQIQMTPWDSQAQYRRWNEGTYKPSAQASHLTDKFHAAERRVRTIRQNRRISLHRVARVGRMPLPQGSSLAEDIWNGQSPALMKKVV